MHVKTQPSNSTARRHQPDDKATAQPLAVCLAQVTPLFALLLVLWVVVGIEWLWSSSVAAPNPMYATVLAALMTVYVAGRARAAWQEVRRADMLAESAGEVSRALDRLRGLGYKVLHDIPADSGNIAHVIICTHGVFCIESRLRRKPAAGDARVRYDGAALSLNGGPFDSSAVNEARIRGRQLQRIIRETSGLELPVQPVIILPGWSIDAVETQNHAEVWVITLKVLPMWIRNAPERIGMKDVKRAACELTAYLDQYA